MKCIIVEDNPHDLDLLKYYVQKEHFLEFTHSFANAVEAIAYINKFHPPLIFLDIDMPVVKGIDLYKSLAYKPVCIFVSSYSEFAIESYEIQAFDFILKPVTADRFNDCIRRLGEYEELKKRADLYNTQFQLQNILVKEGTATYKIHLNDIVYIEALNDYSKVVTKTKKYITLSKLKHFLEKLPGEDFIRIHRSYAVSKSAVEKISGNEMIIGGQKLPIGKTYRLQLKTALF